MPEPPQRFSQYPDDLYPDSDGNWIRAEDYDQLLAHHKAEVERMKGANNILSRMNEANQLRAEAAEQRAERAEKEKVNLREKIIDELLDDGWSEPWEAM